MPQTAGSTPPGWEDRFFQHFREHANISRAAEFAGVHRSTIYYNRRNDSDFEQRLQDTLQTHYDLTAQRAFEAATVRAIDGWDEPVYQGGELVGEKRKYSDRLLLELLQRLHPMFRDTAAEDRERVDTIEFIPVDPEDDGHENEDNVDPSV